MAKVTHESLQKKILDAEKALKAAKDEYKAFCAENPYKLPKQPSVHELRMMRLKNDKPTDLDHKKSNAAHAAKASK